METVKVLYANKSVHGKFVSELNDYQCLVVLGGKYDTNPKVKLAWKQVYETKPFKETTWTQELREKVANHLFEVLNVDSNPLHSADNQQMIREQGLHHTSMSIGDIVQFSDGTQLVCHTEGWEKLSPMTIQTEDGLSIFWSNPDAFSDLLKIRL
tara:strand:+ start:14650 stop:15111 length:462 start_codon:yes stop_codon:yes gene_type:complete